MTSPAELRRLLGDRVKDLSETELAAACRDIDEKLDRLADLLLHMWFEEREVFDDIIEP